MKLENIVDEIVERTGKKITLELYCDCNTTWIAGELFCPRCDKMFAQLTIKETLTREEVIRMGLVVFDEL